MNEPWAKRVTCRAGRAWAIALAIGVLGALAFGIALAPKEPSYGGRSLGSWLRLLHNPKSQPAHEKAAIQAIRAMGTNLLPALLDAIDKPGDGFLVRFVRPAQGLGLRYQLPMHLAWSSAGLLRLSVGYLDEPTRREAARLLFEAYLGERGQGKSDQRRQLDLANTIFGQRLLSRTVDCNSNQRRATPARGRCFFGWLSLRDAH